MKLHKLMNWFLSPEKETVVRDTTSGFDSMVGEPVISFILSLRKDPKRYSIHQTNDDIYDSGMCYVLKDKKTGREYTAYHKTYGGFDFRILFVSNLPFQLNGWEMRALEREFINFRKPARERRDRIVRSKQSRLRDASRLKENESRLKFAEQFK